VGPRILLSEEIYSHRIIGVKKIISKPHTSAEVLLDGSADHTDLETAFMDSARPWM
jgi:hypothetical protein